MKSISLSLSAWMRPVRLLLATCVCALLLVSQALPAYSAPSSPRSGEANLTKIELEAQKAVQKDPYSRKQTQEKAKEGLNEIQGSADAEKQLRPDNVKKGNESVEQKLQKALEKAEGKLKGEED